MIVSSSFVLLLVDNAPQLARLLRTGAQHDAHTLHGRFGIEATHIPHSSPSPMARLLHHLRHMAVKGGALASFTGLVMRASGCATVNTVAANIACENNNSATRNMAQTERAEVADAFHQFSSEFRAEVLSLGKRARFSTNLYGVLRV